MALTGIARQEELGRADRLAWGLAELAAALGISTDTLFRARKNGQLRVIHVAGRCLVPNAEVDRILSEGLCVRRGRPPKAKPTTSVPMVETVIETTTDRTRNN
jgi:hypothetical protein